MSGSWLEYNPADAFFGGALKQALCDAAWPTLLAALLFIGSLNGGLVADDTRFLVDTPRALVTPRQAFTQTLWNRNPPGWTNQHYRPLALLAFAAIFRLFGADYAVFHAANALLNAGATAALFFFLTGLRFPRRICLAAALLFAVDPLHVEAVAWITGMMETLAGGLVLTSLACFAYGRRFASVLLAALAILTKESSMALLPMILPSNGGDAGASPAKERGGAPSGPPRLTCPWQSPIRWREQR